MGAPMTPDPRERWLDVHDALTALEHRARLGPLTYAERARMAALQAEMARLDDEIAALGDPWARALAGRLG